MDQDGQLHKLMVHINKALGEGVKMGKTIWFTGQLFWSGICYRCCILVATAISLNIFLTKVANPLALALYINIINMMVYYIYHYWFLKFFKMGGENGIN